MKTFLFLCSSRLARPGFFMLTIGLLAMSSARAGLTVDIHLYHDAYGYYFYPWLTADANTPGFPNGYYMIASPQIPANGSQLQYQATNNTLTYVTGGGSSYGDFNSFLYGITNGQWSIFVTNSISTNQYKFTVTVTGITSNLFGPPVTGIFPNNGAVNVTSQPLFSWTGPANWVGNIHVQDDYIDTNGNDNYETSADLPGSQTSWACPVVLPNGTNNFSVNYTSNVTVQIVASTPINNLSQSISAWTSTATLESEFANALQFIVGTSAQGATGHTLIAHYTFDNGNSLGQDSSPANNSFNSTSVWGASQPTGSTNAEVGNAVQLFGTSSLSTYGGKTMTDLDNVLAGSFTFSGWVKTTNSVGGNSDAAVNGATVFWSYNDHNNTNDTIPLAITGSKAAFFTRDGSGNSSTIHSTTSVNDGNYHLITVTRNQLTGEKRIYVDGNFEASEYGTTQPLNGNNYFLSIGGSGISSYTGLLDDLQIYSGVLSATEVSALYNQPGTSVPDVAASSAGSLIVHYDFDEGTALAPDVSGNGNNIIVADNNDGDSGDDPTITTDSISGAGSVSFDGNGFLAPSTNLLSTIAGTFSLSLWVKTTDNSGSQGDLAWEGDCIVSADVPGSLVNGDIIPVALTGGQVAFNTGSPQNGDNTINSSATVNDGQWHHIVVMRNQLTGEKDIYIDGQFDTSDFDTTNLLSDPKILTIGCKADASNSDPDSPSYTGSNGYNGQVDDLQIYNRVLAPNEVTYLYQNPGLTLASTNTVTDTNVVPVITANPFSQTNYPGYDVALSASATGVPTPTWQWYEVGSGAINGATNALFIPGNSGSSAVIGSYYAIATNLKGSANTSTALVTFASMALPPDWSRVFKTQFSNNPSGSTFNYVIAGTMDASGNLYTSGSVTGTNLFGTNLLISANGNTGSSFLKQTATGTPIWGRCMTNNGNGSSYSQSIALAPDGGIFASGGFSGTNWLGTNNLVDVAGASAFIARFDANGNNLWVRTLTSTNQNFSANHLLVADPAGNVTCSALISGYTTLGSTNYNAVGQTAVLVQFDINGNVRWLQTPSAWPGYLVYNNGRIYGLMGGNATNYIGGVTNLSDRANALFALNATNGQGIWVQGLGAKYGQGNPSGFVENPTIAVSGTNIFVVGSAWGSNAVFGAYSVTFPTSKGQFFARYDTNGNAQLATSFGSQTTWVWATAANASGGVYVGGDFDTYSIFGNDIIAAPFYQTVQYIGSGDPQSGPFSARIPGQTFLAKFDYNGNPLWARLGESESSYANCRDVILASDGIWSCGFFNQTTVFGTNTLFSSGEGFLAKITDGISATLISGTTITNATFQFSFLSQSGYTNTIQYRTNLVSGSWQTYSNLMGDGSLKTIPIPLSTFGNSKQGFVRVSTH